MGMETSQREMENLISAAPELTLSSFYRTTAGAEIDLVLDLPGGERWAVEIKKGRVPRLEKGFHFARQDLLPDRCLFRRRTVFQKRRT